jgi:hypothetical protein
MAWFFVILLYAGGGKLFIFPMFENGGKSGADDDQWCQLKNLYFLKKKLAENLMTTTPRRSFRLYVLESASFKTAGKNNKKWGRLFKPKISADLLTLYL